MPFASNGICKYLKSGEDEMKQGKQILSLYELLQEELTDSRAGNAIQHELWDIIIIGLLTILCNGNTFVDMQIFGETHLPLLQQFLALPHGIPSHDTFGRVFAALDPAAMDNCFAQWVEMIRSEMDIHHVAIDGKTVRGSGKAGHLARHIVTAFASEVELVLGQRSTAEKSNEITEIPRLLDMLCLEHRTVTIDAMGSQKTIAGKIIEKKGEYILALKENHPTLLEDIRFYMEQDVFTQPSQALKSMNLYAETKEKDHGRIEHRECWLLPDLSWQDESKEWIGMSGAAVIRTSRQIQNTGEVSESDRYFLYSDKTMTAERFVKLQRAHWRIENNLHWVLDNVYQEDKCQTYMENAAVVLNILRKLCLHLTKRETSFKASMRTKRLRCSYDFPYALKVLGFES